MDPFNLVNYRKSLKVNLDIFREFQFNGEDQNDREILDCAKNSIRDLSKTCFIACVDLSKEKQTSYEKTCIKNCVRGSFSGMNSIIEYHEQNNRRLSQDQQQAIV